MSHTPIFVVRILLNNSVIQSKNVAFIAFFVVTFVLILNSLVNPIIYCVTIRQFRIALIEILFGKSNVQAEDFEMPVFGSTNNHDNDSDNNNDDDDDDDDDYDDDDDDDDGDDDNDDDHD